MVTPQFKCLNQTALTRGGNLSSLVDLTEINLYYHQVSSLTFSSGSFIVENTILS